MILVTSAGGKTGKAMIAHFAKSGEAVRAMMRRTDADDELTALGAGEIVHGDLTDASDIAAAAAGCRVIYYICPNMTEDEKTIGGTTTATALYKNIAAKINGS